MRPDPVGGPISKLVDAVGASKAGVLNQALTAATDKEGVLELTRKNTRSMNGVNAVTALHRLAVIEKRRRAEREALLRDTRFEELFELIIEKSVDFTPRMTADVFWSCATLRHFPPALLRPLLTRVAAHLGTRERDNFEPNHLSIVMWAFAVLEIKPMVLIERLEQIAHQSISGFNTQNCANLLWGFAKLRAPTTLLGPVSKHLISSGLIEECKPVEIADMSFAAASIGDAESAAPMLQAFKAQAQPDKQLEGFTSRQLVTLLWAFANIDVHPGDEALTVWRQTVLELTSERPMMAADRRNLETALVRFGEEIEDWQPKRGGEDENAAEGAVQKADCEDDE